MGIESANLYTIMYISHAYGLESLTEKSPKFLIRAIYMGKLHQLFP
jgi:hypothetical protein